MPRIPHSFPGFADKEIMLVRIWAVFVVAFSGLLIWVLIDGSLFDELAGDLIAGEATRKQVSAALKGKKVIKTAEQLTEEIDKLCKHLREEMTANKLEPAFADVDLKLHEERLEDASFLDVLKNGCLKEAKDASHRIELDIFSSDFTGEDASDQIQVQVSVFDKKSSNKIFESGIHFELTRRE